MPQITYGFPTGSKDIAQWNNCPRRFTNKIIREKTTHQHSFLNWAFSLDVGWFLL
jgi:hypothetical protein